MRAEEDNRKNKRIYLTEKGKEIAERIVVPLMDAERRALAAIGEQQAEVFLKTMKKHTELFREEIDGTDQRERSPRRSQEPPMDDTKMMPA